MRLLRIYSSESESSVNSVTLMSHVTGLRNAKQEKEVPGTSTSFLLEECIYGRINNKIQGIGGLLIDVDDFTRAYK